MEDQVQWQGVLEEQNDVQQDAYKDLDVDFFNEFVSFGGDSGVALDIPLVEGNCSENCQHLEVVLTAFQAQAKIHNQVI